ncbi:MAG: DUF2207 domain-containing protein [Spirochaetia bacterium]|nr:DUF2207 domain-containing protein [Spirochaetia bacterium]
MNVFQSLFRNKQRNKRVLLLIILLISSLSIVSAAEYTIDSFDTTITITKKGYYDISETATLTFNVPKHGFFRSLPTFFSIGEQGNTIYARVSKIRASDELDVSRSSQDVTMRLGSANRTLIGTHEYDISYRYDIGEDRFEDSDEFYYNIIGVDWQEPIKETSFTLIFPFPVDKNKIHFNRGVYGTVGNKGVNWTIDETSTKITGSVDTLQEGEAVTIRVELPDGYYLKRTNFQLLFAPIALLLTLFVLVVAIKWWNRYGKDKDLIIVPQFYPPEGISPMDAGYIIDGQLDPHDVTSMLFYWADKGSVTIIEEKKKVSFVKGKPLSKPSSHEEMLFNRFFALGNNGVVTEKDLTGEFSKVYVNVQGKIGSFYTKDKSLSNKTSTTKARLITLFTFIPILSIPLVMTLNYVGISTLIIGGVALLYMIINATLFYTMFRKWHIRKKASKFMFGLILVIIFFVFVIVLFGFALFVTTERTLSYISIPIALLSILLLSLFSVITTQRSAYGVEMLEKVLGLRDFIEKVELDELKRMIDKDPSYYYKILSFAIVLGLEKKWAKKFSSFTLEAPTWYAGDALLFNSLALSAMVNRADSSLISNLAPKGSSTGPGGHSFGGSGGFSGGGFGGGGGGAW